MRVRHVVAAGVIAIGGVLGSAGIAAAQTTPTPTGQNKQAACAKATAQDRETKVEGRITKLQSRLATAQQNNHPDAVKLIQFRIDWLQKVEQHLKDATNLINSECQST
jgi:hypothetical protein